MNATLHRWVAATLLVAGTFAASACSDDSVADSDVVEADSVAEADPTTTTTIAITAPESGSETDLPAEAATSDPESVADTEPAVWSNESEGPGLFRTEGFATPFSFTVEESWVPAFTGAPDNANIRLPGVAIFFVLDTTAGSADALIAQLRAAEGVELTDETDMEVGGQPGVRYVISGEHDGLAIATTSGEFTLDGPADEAGRVTVLEIDGSTLAIVEVTVPDDPDPGWMETAAVIETIAWG